MKFKYHIPKILCLAIVVAVVFGMQAHTAHAANPIVGLWNFAVGAAILPSVSAVVGFLAYLALTVTAWGLSLAGALLNVGMFLTTHLDVFISKAPVIYTVWATIRDLSSILLIFFILYAAITMIIGQKPANYGQIIKNIIIIGVLINFSFFFTRVMIDVSNIVSMQFYDAIAPTNIAANLYTNGDGTIDMSKLATALLNSPSGGMSGAMVGALNINQWWKNNTGNFMSTTTTAAQGGSDLLNIILASVGGIVVMIITQLNIIAVAAAAILRTVMLVFLLAFSPVWIASWAMPELKELTKKWTGQFYAQLIFLPVYLAFLYVALLIVTKSGLNQVVNSPNSTSIGNVINLFVGFGIVIVMLTVPLLAAIAVTSAFGGDSGIIQKWTNGARSFVGRRTFGRMAYGLNESKLMRKFAASQPTIGGLVSQGLSKGSSYGFGVKKGGSYEDVLKAKKKGEEAMHKRIGDLDRSRYSSQAEFDKAKEQARGYQEKYRSGLPWKSSIMSFMLDNRANKQSQLSLSDEADLKENRVALAKLTKEIAALTPKSDLARLGMTDEDKETLRQKQAEYTEVKGAVDRGSGKKKQKDIKDLAKALEDETKGESGEKEDKPKEAPKTT